MSVDDDNMVAVWDMQNLGEAAMVRVDIPMDEEKVEGSVVTALYSP